MMLISVNELGGFHALFRQQELDIPAK